MKWTQSLHRMILSVVLAAVAAPVVAQDRIPWITDLRQARDVAERQNRLVLLHFWSDDCVPCKQVERQVFNKPEFIRALTTGYIPVKINANQQPQLADFYNIERVPTDVIVTPEGREVQRFQSLQDSNQYIAMLDGIRSRASVGSYPIDSSRAPVATRPVQDNTASSPYGSYTPTSNPSNGAGGYGQSPAIQPPTNQSAIGSPTAGQSYGQDRYANNQLQPQSPLTQPTAPQQQPLAPRYANPYADQAQADSTSNGSRWGNQGTQTNTQPVAPSQPQNNVYAQGNRYGGNAQITTGQYRQAQQTNPTLDQRIASRQPQQGYTQPNQSVSPSAPAGQANTSQPKFALEGYCPVTLVQNRKWTPGDKKWGANHQGRIYLFAGPEQQQQFLANPHVFAPLMDGFDPVRFAETGQLVPGRREFGLYIDEPGPIALFADEAALERFHANSGYYFNAIQQATRQQSGNATR